MSASGTIVGASGAIAIASAGASGAIAIASAAGLDWTLEEPPQAVHPVAAFGRIVAPLATATDTRLGGAVIAIVCPLAAAVVAGGFAWAGGLIGEIAGAIAAGAVLFVTISRRRLLRRAREAIEAADDGPAAARDPLQALVGRDIDDLSTGEIRSGAVESAAENLSDGLVAPLCAFVVCALVSLPLAAAAAVWVKAINTLDSMVGYPDRPEGWASARLDDAVMWLPARASALLLALAALDPGALVRAQSQAQVPSSPNAGWPMATMAAILGVRLEKPGAYVLDGGGAEGTSETNALPRRADAERGVRIVGRAGTLALGIGIGIVIAVSTVLEVTVAWF